MTGKATNRPVKQGQAHNYRLRIVAQNTPTLLEKMLQVCRYRGFSVVAMEARLDSCEQTNITRLLINIDVQSTNRIELLIKQLDKVFGITQIEQSCILSSVKQACS